MARFKIIRNNTNTDRKLLQARIETALVEDVNLIVKWSNRDKNEIVAELLKYALSQEEDFQAYKLSVDQSSTEDMGKKPVEANRPPRPIQRALVKSHMKQAIRAVVEQRGFAVSILSVAIGASSLLTRLMSPPVSVSISFPSNLRCRTQGAESSPRRLHAARHAAISQHAAAGR